MLDIKSHETKGVWETYKFEAYYLKHVTSKGAKLNTKILVI